MFEETQKIRKALLNCLAEEQDNNELRRALEALNKIEQGFSVYPDGSTVNRL